MPACCQVEPALTAARNQKYQKRALQKTSKPEKSLTFSEVESDTSTPLLRSAAASMLAERDRVLV